jgi:prevent-host-death family protein
MRYESISNAKNNLSMLLREVQQGESIIITDRGIPVARLEPVANLDDYEARLRGLVERGVVTLPKRRPGTTLLSLPMPKVGAGPSAVDYLLEERESGR